MDLNKINRSCNNYLHPSTMWNKGNLGKAKAIGTVLSYFTLVAPALALAIKLGTNKHKNKIVVNNKPLKGQDKAASSGAILQPQQPNKLKTPTPATPPKPATPPPQSGFNPGPAKPVIFPPLGGQKTNNPPVNPQPTPVILTSEFVAIKPQVLTVTTTESSSVASPPEKDNALGIDKLDLKKIEAKNIADAQKILQKEADDLIQINTQPFIFADAAYVPFNRTAALHHELSMFLDKHIETLSMVGVFGGARHNIEQALDIGNARKTGYRPFYPDDKTKSDEVTFRLMMLLMLINKKEKSDQTEFFKEFAKVFVNDPNKSREAAINNNLNKEILADKQLDDLLEKHHNTLALFIDTHGSAKENLKSAFKSGMGNETSKGTVPFFDDPAQNAAFQFKTKYLMTLISKLNDKEQELYMIKLGEKFQACNPGRVDIVTTLLNGFLGTETRMDFEYQIRQEIENSKNEIFNSLVEKYHKELTGKFQKAHPKSKMPIAFDAIHFKDGFLARTAKTLGLAGEIEASNDKRKFDFNVWSMNEKNDANLADRFIKEYKTLFNSKLDQFCKDIADKINDPASGYHSNDGPNFGKWLSINIAALPGAQFAMFTEEKEAAGLYKNTTPASDNQEFNIENYISPAEVKEIFKHFKYI